MAGLPKKRLLPLVAGGVAAVGIAVGGAVWWTNKQHYESTDNAFVQADKVTVASLVDGNVVEVLVEDNARVRAGQVLVRLDQGPIRARLAQAEANAAALEAAVRQVDDKARLEQALITQKSAGVEAARAQSQLAQAESARYSTLAKSGIASPQRAQTVKAGEQQAQAGVLQAQAGLEAERRAAAALGSAREQSAAQAAAARAVVEQAKIDLARTEIRAPIDGVVGARGVRLGQYVRPGAALMSLVPLGDAYVVANFKETQVARLRIGQPVIIHADAFGKQTIRGRVDSFAPATGAEFALIPVENAVGNFTKITQRLPVKIRVDRNQSVSGALRPGLSVAVKVDVTKNTGPTFAEAAAIDPPALQAAR